MCGIAGIVKFDGKKVNPQRVKKMTDTLKHRGPDGEGLYVNQFASAALGHRRLSILDLSDAGKQPFISEDGRYILSFNGEIYNYIELRSKLIKMGESFVSSTDSEVLLKMFIQFGEECLTQFDGMFAFAIWDNKKQALFCARDRFGEKPFFYFKDECEFSFASEIKALWSAGINKRADLRKAYEYLLYGTIRDSNNQSSTFYENINELPSSHCLWVTKNGETKLKKYWDVDISIENNEFSYGEATEKFKAMFQESVSKRLRSDVALGSSLSGGLDSSSIVCLIDQLKTKGQKQETFSARFKNFEKDEGRFIKEVLKKCPSIEHHEIYPSEKSSYRNLERIIFHQDEPFNSLSIAAQYEVMQKASKTGVKVLLDGQGADEYLAGYPSLHKAFLMELKRKKSLSFSNEVRAFESNSKLKFDHGGWQSQIRNGNFKWYAEIAKFRRKNISSDSNYFIGIHPELVREFRDKNNPIVKPSSFKGRLKQALLGRGLGDLLRYADRNSMANSLEVRLPFLDHQLIEYVLSLPNEFFIHDGWTKYILRKSMQGILPDRICWRKDKVGYEPPQNNWMQTSDYLDLIESSKQKLMKEKIIAKAHSDLEWHYVMLASFI